MAEKYRPYVWAIKRRLPAATVRFNEYDAGRIVEVCINCGDGDRFISVHAPMQPSLISTIVAIAVDRSAEPAWKIKASTPGERYAQVHSGGQPSQVGPLSLWAAIHRGRTDPAAARRYSRAVEYIALAFAAIVLALAIVPAPVIRTALLVAWVAMMAAVVLAAIPYSG